MFLEAQRGAGPMHGGPAHGLDDPGRQIGEILVHAPRTRRRPLVCPGELGETFPFVVDEILDFIARSRFQDHRLDALEGQFGAERAAAGAGTDDHHEGVVIEVERSSHGSVSLKKT